MSTVLVMMTSELFVSHSSDDDKLDLKFVCVSHLNDDDKLVL